MLASKLLRQIDDRTQTSVDNHVGAGHVRRHIRSEEEGDVLFDHTKLTYRHMGRDFRLPDVGGNIVNKMLA